jgi:hypothetical protein
MEEHYAYSTVRNTMDEARLRLESSTMVPIRTLAHACMVAMSLGYLTQPTGADLTVFPAT